MAYNGPYFTLSSFVKEATMRRMTLFLVALTVLVGATLACSAGPVEPSATPDTQATIDAAVAATSTAQANAQATIDAAVAATAVAAPSPTPGAEYVTMTEEELAALIDEAVTEATAASEACATTSSEAAGDSEVSAEEVTEIQITLAGAEEAIAYAEELIDVYYGLYGELALETLELLQAMEEDLVVLAEAMTDIAEALVEVEAAIAQGVALAEETVAQLEGAAQAAQAKAAEIQAQRQAWVQDLQAEREQRVNAALAVEPNAVASDRVAALRGGFEYVDGVRRALEDRQVSQTELANIAQLGANARAGLESQGGPQLQRAAGSIDEITTQIARGQIPQAQASLGDFEAALGNRPGRQ
jgi:hypothetical protein